MQADRLDLLQFHTWNYADPSYLDTLSYLQELKDEGLIRHLGLTNTDTAHLRLILNSGFEIVSNQVCFSLLDQRARNNGMTELCRQHGVTLLAFGTVAGGFLTERWLDQSEPEWNRLETWSEMKYGRFIREAGGWAALQDLLRIVHEIAQRHEVSMANIACRYILDQPAVGGIIIGARLGVSEHRRDNLRLFQLELDPASRSELDAAVARLRPIPGDCGDEYRRPPYLTASGDLSHHIDVLPPPFEVRRGEDGRQRAPSSVRGPTRRGRPATGSERNGLGGYRRIQPGSSPWPPHRDLRHHCNSRRSRHRRIGPRLADTLHHRQDRGRAAVAGRRAAGRRDDARLHTGDGALGPGGPRSR